MSARFTGVLYVYALGIASLFEHLVLSQQPALLIGMDMLGGLDSLSIDYGARTLRLRARSRDRR
jgi:hypothetical protein